VSSAQDSTPLACHSACGRRLFFLCSQRWCLDVPMDALSHIFHWLRVFRRQQCLAVTMREISRGIRE
jgi:hypothetical protein